MLYAACFIILVHLLFFLYITVTNFLLNGGFFFWERESSGNVYRSISDFWSNYAEMSSTFKIYVYRPDGDDQTAFDTTIISGINASEGHFFKNLQASYFLTDDPEEAHLFFIPIPCPKMYHKIRWCDTGSGKFPSEGYLIDSMRSTLMKNQPYKARVFYIPVSCHLMPQKEAAYEESESPTLERYEKDVFLRFPYWNTSLGIDPFFLNCHEINPRVTEEVLLLSKNSIRVVCSPGNNIGFMPYKDISLPMVMQPPPAAARGSSSDNRTILGYWEGICDSAISNSLVVVWEGEAGLDVQCTEEYQDGRPEKFWAAQFCICPGGSIKCITMAIHYGCVPVIFTDHPNLPFNDILDWHKFSIIVEKGELYELKGILEEKAEAEFAKLHSNFESQQVQRHFRWITPSVRYDAFHMVLYELYMEALSCEMQRKHGNKPLKHSTRSYQTRAL